MDKTFLIRMNNAFKKVRTQLLLNDKIRSLLYYDVIEADTVAPEIEQAAEHIFIQPIVDVDAKEPFNKKNYITITIPEGQREDNRMDYVFRVIVMCEKSTWSIEGDSRPLLVAQEVVNILDGFKTELSNTLMFTGIVETVTNKDVCGYSVLFEVSDGISDVNEK